MTEDDRFVRAFRSVAADAQRDAAPTDEAWQQIRGRIARRHRRRFLRRLATVVAPLLAVGGITAGAVEAYVPASHPQRVVTPSPPSTVPVSPPPTTVPTTPPSTTVAPTSTATTVAPTSTATTVVPASAAPPSTSAGAALSSVSWASITYPFSCGTTLQGPTGYRVVQVAYPEPAAGHKVAVVMVECNSGAGTPPVALLVYDGASDIRAPHLAQTLVQVSSRYQASGFTATGTTLSAAVSGFSSTNVPNCCPDVHTTLTWHWTTGGYQPGH